jgi:hypothetical protein
MTVDAHQHSAAYLSDPGGSSSSSEATSACAYGSSTNLAKQQQHRRLPPNILPVSSKGSQSQQRSQRNNGEGVRRGVEQMKEALEMIPAEEKRAYTEAMRRAPRLMEIECNFERCVRMLISSLSCF